MELNPNAQLALEILQQHGHEAYVVGGCVRDNLMGNAANDWDVCTSALPGEVQRCFANYHVIETGLKHGTVTVMIDHSPIEITTYRADGTYSDNRRPDEVTFIRSLREDLARRDFTMNAIAYSPSAGLVDPFGGARDIRTKVVRCVDEPERRFQEDGLRNLRALRFASRLGFTLEKNTAAGIHRNRNLLAGISAERLAAELCGILEGDHVRDILLNFADVLRVFIPEIGPMVGCAQHNPYHQYDVWRHTVESVAAAENSRVLRLAMLFHDIGKPATHTMGEDGADHFYGHAKVSVQLTETILKRLRFDNATIAAVVALIKWHDVPMDENTVVKWLNRLGEERFSQLLLVKAADTRAQAVAYQKERLIHLDMLRKKCDAILEEQRCFALKDLAVNGRDLIALGLKPGIDLGKTLNMLLEAVMDGLLPNEKTALLGKARRLSSNQ